MWLDRLAIGLSGLCLAHCIGSAVFVALLASAGGILVHHSIHEVGLALAICFAVLGLGRGVMRHGFMLPGSIGGLGIGVMAGALTMPHNADEVIYTIIGVGLVALGHDLNRRALI
ncbi:MerC domain-containing protein [Edaphosphingomonas haloaromaticamans]|uniref:MerC mercury resistance protein n=1 Tax=Edaphosphingomonas haloaromaticamans TaxID=653954 RepID=A0A1S1HBZ0_9SPHN|nr:MerC domain-containing protein [Sphingomonas haloaromaticamans]OHT18951.1 MerC mercury resistance protein [Sphingomonas haloaromaticamans]